MTFRLTKPDAINVLIENANWAWPQAVTRIFKPRGINALVAPSTDDAINIVRNNKIHLAILDARSELRLDQSKNRRNESSGLNLLRTIHNQNRLLPCILLSTNINSRILNDALALGAFTVLSKPVDLHLLASRIDRLFAKLYDGIAPSNQPPRNIKP